jgi:hypothetical protein
VSRIVNTRGTVARTWMEFLFICFAVFVFGPVVPYFKWVLVGMLVGIPLLCLGQISLRRNADEPHPKHRA